MLSSWWLVALVAVSTANPTRRDDENPQDPLQGIYEEAASEGTKRAALAEKPNIVFILADDHGWEDISWNNAEIKTPHLQALADEGVVLDWNYVQPACTPSRAAMLTGKYPFRMGLQHRVFLEGSPECVPLKEQFLPQALKDLGYATHMRGKWHLGMCDIKCTPPHRGFDTYKGFLNGMLNHFYHTVAGGYDWHNQDETDTSNNGTYATEIITRDTVELINNHDASAGPFFIYMSQAATHYPFQAPNAEILERYPDVHDWDRKQYLGLLSAMDDSVGEVVKALKDKGLYDNTIIIFSSDNGGEEGPASNGKLRGAKASAFEGGTRVAGMVSSPLMTKKGYRHQGDIHITDWFPTLISLAGGSTSGLDGIDQSDMIMNGGDSKREEVIYNIDTVKPELYGKAAIKKNGWKLLMGFGGLFDGWESDHTIDIIYKADVLKKNKRKKRGHYSFDWAALAHYSQLVDNEKQLFNLVDDPEERHNLYAEKPDIAAPLEARLNELLPLAAPLDYAHMAISPKALPVNYGGLWTPGWGISCSGVP